MSKNILLVLAFVCGGALASSSYADDGIVVKDCSGENPVQLTFTLTYGSTFVARANVSDETLTAPCKIHLFNNSNSDSIDELTCSGTWSSGEAGTVDLDSEDGILNVARLKAPGFQNQSTLFCQ